VGTHGEDEDTTAQVVVRGVKHVKVIADNVSPLYYPRPIRSLILNNAGMVAFRPLKCQSQAGLLQENAAERTGVPSSAICRELKSSSKPSFVHITSIEIERN
jgi:hypothetical protein